MSTLSFLPSIYVCIHTKPFDRKLQTYAPLALNISVHIVKNKDIFLDNLSIMIKTRDFFKCIFFRHSISKTICVGNWYHPDYYDVYNLICFQRKQYVTVAFCSYFINFASNDVKMKLTASWQWLYHTVSSCEFKVADQKLFRDLPEITHLSQFLELLFLVW